MLAEGGWDDCACIVKYYSIHFVQVVAKLMVFTECFCSVLTRILPWVVAEPPLQKNRGPVRMLEGQRLKGTRGTNNLSPHSKWFLT